MQNLNLHHGEGQDNGQHIGDGGLEGGDGIELFVDPQLSEHRDDESGGDASQREAQHHGGGDVLKQDQEHDRHQDGGEEEVEHSDGDAGADAGGKGFEVNGQRSLEHQEQQGEGGEQGGDTAQGFGVDELYPAGADNEAQKNQEQDIGDHKFAEHPFGHIAEHHDQ